MSFFATQLLSSLVDTRVKESIEQINKLETRSYESIDRIQQKSINAAIDIGSAQTRSAEAAKAAQDSASTIQKRLDALPEINNLLKDNDAIIAGLANNSAFVDHVIDTVDARIRSRPPTVNNVTNARALGTVYPNGSNRTRLVILSGVNAVAAYTMYANAAAVSTGLPSGKTGGANAATMAMTSFAFANFASSVSFIVPANWFYNVTTDGGSISVATWIEVDL
jgi:hypothetical protein